MDLPLGKPTEYRNQYDNNLLVAVPRALGRQQIGLQNDANPFQGFDFWNCYEVSWLDKKGKPCVRILQFKVSSGSEFIIESKSLKLYLNSFNGTKFELDSQVSKIIQKDLSKVAGSEVTVNISTLSEHNGKEMSQFPGINIDNLSVDITEYNVNSNLLKLDISNEIVSESVSSELLKSNCLITNQPDWASIYIQYTGHKIDHKSLLKYIISFRNHNEFHEQCVEHIFNDIMNICDPDSLTVFAKYTRRGGIDINPIRTTENLDNIKIDLSRGIRQ